jgi:hypothetical protein
MARTFAFALAVAGSSAMGVHANSQDDCQNILGVLYLANGTPAVRLRDAVSHTTYGILLSDDFEYPEDPVMPDQLKGSLDWNTRIHGSFLVCVKYREKGFFPMAHIVEANDTSIEKLRKS